MLWHLVKYLGKSRVEESIYRGWPEIVLGQESLTWEVPWVLKDSVPGPVAWIFQVLLGVRAEVPDYFIIGSCLIKYNDYDEKYIGQT